MGSRQSCPSLFVSALRPEVLSAGAGAKSILFKKAKGDRVAALSTKESHH